MARTGYKITVYLDDNPNSSGYMETYEERTYDESTCPLSEDDLVLVSNTCEIDLSGYTGYRILTYYNRTTREYTEVKEIDSACTESSTDEQWVNSGSPYCETTAQGINTGYMVQVQVQTNPNAPSYGQIRYNRYVSPDCTMNGCPTWDEIQRSCHITVNNCSLTFDGTADVTQIDINPLSSTYNQTRTINVEDSDCTNCTSTVFSWVEVGEYCGNDELLCSNGLQQVSTNSYTVSRKYKTIGGGTPIPMDEYKAVLYEENSPDCGYIAPQYRWDVVTGQYVCDYETYTKYQMKVKMVSYDNGETWSMVEPMEVTSGDVISYNSPDCGYKIYAWNVVDGYICDDCIGSKLKVGVSASTYELECTSATTLTSNDILSVTSNTSVDWSVIGSCIEIIDDGTFSGCTALQFCRIPNTVTTIGNSAFTNCYGMFECPLPDSIETIGNDAFNGAESLAFINLPNGLTSLGSNAFRDCLNFRYINIPLSLTQIPNGCFYNCDGLTDIELHENITSIGDYAFYDCESLYSVIVHATTPPALGTSVFTNTNSDLKIYVPAASVNIYKAASNWSTWANKIYAIQ